MTAPEAETAATPLPAPPTPEGLRPGDLSSETMTVTPKTTVVPGVSDTPPSGSVPQATTPQTGETVASSEPELRARDTAPVPGTIASEGSNQKTVHAAAPEIGKAPSANAPVVAAPVAVPGAMVEEGPVERVAKPVRSTPESVAVKGQMTVANPAPQPSNLSLGQVGTPVSGSENSNPGAVNRVDAPQGYLGPEEAARPAPAPAPPSPLPPAAATMPERLVLSKAAKGSRSDPAAEVTVTVTNSTEAAEQPRAQQIAVGLAPGKDQGNSGGGFGSEGRLAREETLPPLTPTDRPEAKRGAEAVSAVRNDPAARPVLTQLVQAARSAIDGMVEVKLSPEELGRVRMTMSGSDAGLGMNVIVTAERPETLDLIRRNIDLFAADLAEQGFTDLNFSFGGDMTGGEGDDSGGESGQTASSQAPQSVFEARIDSSNVASDGRVDLRL
ncbi:MAG: flagellar hook-length control protein FliK [Silicimonas sp.]|nr:flagellar hook-length control protein FliK [Silicimonas sp.]